MAWRCLGPSIARDVAGMKEYSGNTCRCYYIRIEHTWELRDKEDGMSMLKQAQPVGGWVRSGRTRFIAAAGNLFGGLVAVLHAMASFCAANDAFERSLSFEERLQRTGRIRYR